jgi:hypothetical protein
MAVMPPAAAAPASIAGHETGDDDGATLSKLAIVGSVTSGSKVIRAISSDLVPKQREKDYNRQRHAEKKQQN